MNEFVAPTHVPVDTNIKLFDALDLPGLNIGAPLLPFGVRVTVSNETTGEAEFVTAAGFAVIVDGSNPANFTSWLLASGMSCVATGVEVGATT